MKENLKSIIEYPGVVIFFGLCVAMLAGYLIVPDKEYSQMENRYLQSRPSVSLSSLADGTFMDSFETYTNEQVMFRDFLVKCKSVFVWATGSVENNGIARGDRGFLFDKTTSVSPKASKNVAAIRNFVRESDRDVYIAIAPTSVWVNADCLPAGMPVLDEVSLSNELTLALADEKNGHIIYLYDILNKHRDEYIFYRTDHHWTTKGAGYAYEEIADKMGLEWQDISRYDRSEAYDFYGTHYAKYKGPFVLPDTIEYYDVSIDSLEREKDTEYDLIDTDKFEGFDKYGAFMYGNDGKCVVHADKGLGKNLYIFKDSYANCLIPYLVMNYDNITVMDLRYFGGSVQEELARDPQADILLMYNWSFVNDDNHFYKLADK